jgi:type III secretion system low calcium response chaperone LcrH/SycD
MSIADKVLSMIQSSAAMSVGESLSAEEQESLYTAAYKFYEIGNYQKAGELFLRLSEVNPFEEAYWRGLAGAYQMQKMWQEALHGWALCALMKEEDPLPHYHAAECMLSSGEESEAIKALCKAKELCQKINNLSLLAKIDAMTKKEL